MGRTIEASKYLGAFITIRQAIPRILHLENRCGEKIIKLLLLEGYNRENITATEQEKLIVDFKDIVNSSVLGTPRRKAHWHLINGKDKDGRKVIGDQSMPNTHVRRFLDHFEELADLCLSNDQKRLQKWNDGISLWINLMAYAKESDQISAKRKLSSFKILPTNSFSCGST
jgi:hypothetical protein